MFNRFLQASLLTFLLALILQLGSSTKPPLESNQPNPPFPAQVTQPFSKTIHQVILGWVSHFEGSEPLRRLQEKMSWVRIPQGLDQDSHPSEN